SPQYSDAVIRCQGQEFTVHRLVLCTQSKYFANAFNGDWKESANRTIELNDDDVSVVEAMLHFMYRFDYDDNAHGQVSPAVFNAKVYSLADKYDLSALKLHAKEKFDKAVENCWSADDFPHVISEVYSSTPATDRGLRNVVMRVVYEHLDLLLEKQEFTNMLEETTGFAADVTGHLAKDRRGLKEYRCSGCGFS
ncbi:hypothetical protein AOQ84DRAFT_274788, partial [Glonium stellatum]